MTSDCICPEVQPHGSNPVPPTTDPDCPEHERGDRIPQGLREKVIAAWDASVEKLPWTAGGGDWRVTAERHEALADAYDELRGVADGDRLLSLLCVDGSSGARATARHARSELARFEAAEKNEEQ